MANPAFITQFLTFINQQCRVGVPFSESTDGVLVAVSGGIDSVVLAHLFGQSGLRFAIAHVNFGLRGAESDGDALFVRQLANQYGVAFHTIRVDTAQWADEHHVSIQMAARTLRYDWFEGIRQEYGYAFTATAHHRNDVLETVLLNLVRGTGLAGLHGILARQDRLIRPLLFADRAEIETYAAGHKLDWREDRSNATDDYARNLLRHQVVPVLQQVNPNLLQTFSSTVERLRAAEILMRESLEQAAKVVLKTDKQQTYIDLTTLRTLSEPAFRLAEWLRSFGFSYQHATDIWQSIDRGTGQEFLSATHRLMHERDQLVLVPITEISTSAALPIVLYEPLPEWVTLPDQHQLQFKRFDKPTAFSLPTDAATTCLDADRLTFPLQIRQWQPGDRFRPLGLNGSKLVSDLLADLHMPRLAREQILVLESGGQIAWVIGQRLDHRFRVTARTRHILSVTVE